MKIFNHFLIYYTKILLGSGPRITNVFFNIQKPLLLLKPNLQFQIQNPFFITVDASLLGLGAVNFQLNEENKIKVISYNSQILIPQEQKLSTLDSKLLGMVLALQISISLSMLDAHIQYIFSLITKLFYTVLQKKKSQFTVLPGRNAVNKIIQH